MKMVENNYLISLLNYNEKFIIKKLAIIVFKEKNVIYFYSKIDSIHNSLTRI